MTNHRFRRIVTVLNQRQPDLTVVTDGVHKGQNLSAILRTCDANGLMCLHSVYDAETFRAHRGTTMGTHKWVDTSVYRHISEPLKLLQNDNYQIVAADLSETAVDYRQIDFTRPTALVLGAERLGVSDDANSYIDQCISIPMLGMVESYNVSVACAIILAEARRQREEAGFYLHRKLSDEAFERLLLRWAQPLVARYCDKHNLPYPKLDENGDITDQNWRQG